MNVAISIARPGDFHNGFIETLSALSDPGITPDEALIIHEERVEMGIDTWIATLNEEVVGTFSIFIEKKFIHKGGKVAHIEDVAVRPTMQRKGIGKEMMRAVDALARIHTCYKIILDCGEHNIEFYKKCGYRLHERMMRKDVLCTTTAS